MGKEIPRGTAGRRCGRLLKNIVRRARESLGVIGITVGISTILAGILAMFTDQWRWIIIIVVIALSVRSLFKGIFYNLEEIGRAHV